MSSRIVALLTVNVILSLAALAWLTWVAVDPQYWFPGAYAEQGPRGDQGPRGPAGPTGQPGPVGPDAADAMTNLSSQLDDLTTRLDDVEGGTGKIDELSSRVDELESAVNDTLCPWISEASDYVYSC